MKALLIGLFLSIGMIAAVAQDSPATDTPNTDNPDDVLLSRLCREGNLDAAKALIFRGVPIESNTGSAGATPLTSAADGDRLEVLQFLIDKGAKIDYPDREGATALLHACLVNSIACAMALINAGANVNLANLQGHTPLMYAANAGNDALVAALLAHKADLNVTCNWGPAIFWAASEDKFSTLKILVAAGANLYPKPAGVTTLLALAADQDDPDMIDYIIGQGVPVDIPDADGSTPLMSAAGKGKVKAAIRLLQKGAKIDFQDSRGKTALMLSDNTVATQVLLPQGANVLAKDGDGQTALMSAAIHARQDLIQTLVEKGADINAVDNQGETALTLAGDRGETGTVDFLKSQGAKRTDVHIIGKAEPAQPLSPSHAWALAVGAIFAQTDGLSPKVLGGDDTISGSETTLRTWKIYDKASLLKELDYLRDRGLHSPYQVQGAKLDATSDDDFQQLLTDGPREAKHLTLTRDGYRKWKERIELALDLCRSSMLVNKGFVVGYLTEQEAWTRLMAIARQTQASFGSWQEMSDNFLDGREIWFNRRDARIETCSQLLLNPNDTNSPWNQNAWKTDLSAD